LTFTPLSHSGIQMFMWIYMITRFNSTPKDSKRARGVYLFVSLILLSLTSGTAVINGLGIYRILFEVVPGEENVKMGWDIMDRVNKELLLYGEVTWSVAIFVTDAVLVYRCYTVWFNKKWVSGPPIVLLVVNIGIGAKSIATILSDPSQRDRSLDMANIFISIFLHLIVTILICGRLLHAHRKLALMTSSEKTPSPYLGTISILIESAAPLAVFGIGTAITVALPAFTICGEGWDALPNPIQNLHGAFQFSLCSPLTLSLQLIIFRVAMGWSWADKAESRALISQEMKFADPEAGLRSSFDDGDPN
ncbi:hypothetical protein BKA70DRAFT_1113413, partial [Coprinopsis sp. MPI-PUGE-AT-0042]